MSPRKLTEDNKQEILGLYRTTPETTSTLAERYGVSSSTISRFLKSNLSESEYEDLIQQKRLGRTSSRQDQDQLDETEQPSLPAIIDETEQPSLPVMVEIEQPLADRGRSGHPQAAPPPGFASLEEDGSGNELDVTSSSQAPMPSARPRAAAPLFQGGVTDDSNGNAEDNRSPSIPRRRRRRSSALEQESSNNFVQEDFFPVEVPETEVFEDENLPEVDVIKEILGEDLMDLDDDDEVLLPDEDDWDDEEESPKAAWKGTELRVLPLSKASFPKTCYLVIDRAADLITRPLREFADLGKIPPSEVQQKTLPVFDNQRVARRFSNRSQRVIKVPDGRMLEKTSPYLEAKGITRLLIDGKVYSLS